MGDLLVLLVSLEHHLSPGTGLHSTPFLLYQRWNMPFPRTRANEWIRLWTKSIALACDLVSQGHTCSWWQSPYQISTAETFLLSSLLSAGVTVHANLILTGVSYGVSMREFPEGFNWRVNYSLGTWILPHGMNICVFLLPNYGCNVASCLMLPTPYPFHCTLKSHELKGSSFLNLLS